MLHFHSSESIFCGGTYSGRGGELDKGIEVGKFGSSLLDSLAAVAGVCRRVWSGRRKVSWNHLLMKDQIVHTGWISEFPAAISRDCYFTFFLDME